MCATVCYLATGTNRLVLFPFVWVVFEWIKSWLFTGFPWLDIGYTQVGFVFSAWAPIGGVYLVSFVSLVFSCALVLAFVSRANKRLSFAVLACAVVASSFVLQKIDWVKPHGDPVSATVVQGNIDIEKKWLPDHRFKVLETYASLSANSQKDGKTDLVVWPETAVPYYADQLHADLWHSLFPWRHQGTSLVTGILDRDLNGNEYNAAILLCDGENTKEQTIYRKHHLVPFGEYLPLRVLFSWVFDYLNLPMSGFTPWQGQQYFACSEGIKLGLSICYEDAFAEEHRRGAQDAAILVNISEDAWFGDSFAPHQRVQMARMRAMELAKPLVRSANTGPSMFVDANGELIASTGQFVSAYLSADVQPSIAITPFARFGNWIVYLSLIMLACISVGGVLNRKRK
jgi:apolipoprotein N-acyltransferase